MKRLTSSPSARSSGARGATARLKLRLNGKRAFTDLGGSTVYHPARRTASRAFEVESLILDRNALRPEAQGRRYAGRGGRPGRPARSIAAEADFRRLGRGPLLRLRGHRLPGAGPGRGRDRRGRRSMPPAARRRRAVLVVRRGSGEMCTSPSREAICVEGGPGGAGGRHRSARTAFWT
ncbi:MAG: hypothetical protein MZV64_34135 [Ignavibacteriales bacterium]|nr:hypothetical protein [Ignavibacteriales bacterium]